MRSRRSPRARLGLPRGGARQLLGQGVVATPRRGRAVLQRLHVKRSRRAQVQARAPGRPQVVVDRGAHQRVGEGHSRGSPRPHGLGDKPATHRLVQGDHDVGDLTYRGGQRQRRVLTQHGGRLHRPPRWFTAAWC